MNTSVLPTRARAPACTNSRFMTRTIYLARELVFGQTCGGHVLRSHEWGAG